MNAFLKKIFRQFGYDLISAQRFDEVYFAGVIPYMTDEQKKIIDACRPFTQTSTERLFALIRAVEYISKNAIPGAFVECGVWKGGSVMAMAMSCERFGEVRDIYLFDTFAGMPEGNSVDVDFEGNDETWYQEKNDQYTGQGDRWNAAHLDEVKKNVERSHGGRQRYHFVEGMVESTIPQKVPGSIALLRLDTDFYASTKHELTHLFPRLAPGGVLIIDDYGHFLGARKAVDEYFHEQNIRMLMHRIDYTGIIGIKQ